jgi:hypothetical protein
LRQTGTTGALQEESRNVRAEYVTWLEAVDKAMSRKKKTPDA